MDTPMGTRDGSEDPLDHEFIRWVKTSRHSAQSRGKAMDPGFAVDYQRLRRYLNSLESLSGE
ncbi:MAG: hypothetical protein KGQ93_09105 [Cyanobacteria bacterium REEB459]|nr:hypothetical protein [Cyanobacteria bacterium REEB459]